ncbi:hypothetical protein [Pseudoalteromonas sp. T1lg75]|uniref:hypothetical protein n=1 Tax=Pseudoalteromonas sp. T1lg75 TaxID=2077102 RepID=UPI000CF73AF5|nr:hypothetical protein [Pseudoalteromonas sp. T1lg75]
MKRIIFSSLLVLLSACGQEDKISGDPNSPGYVASQYFFALFNHDSLERASEHAAPKLTRIMYAYGSAEQFTRSVLNMQFDQVSIELDRTEMSVREQYGDHATINLVFTGDFQGKKVDDMRSVKLSRDGISWVVTEVIPDPYGR